MTDTPEQPGKKIIQVRRVVAVSYEPHNYLLTPPKGYKPDNWKLARILRVPYGPLVLWRPKCKQDGECPACEGSAELEAHGADGTWYDVECPKCDGTGEVEIDAAAPELPDVWTDADGNILEPELRYPDEREAQPSQAWLDRWVLAQQTA